MVKIGVLRVLSTDDENLLKLHGRLIEAAIGEVETLSRCIEGHPRGLWNEEEEARAIPKIVRLGREMAQEGVDALIVSCADDPGVKELRDVLEIPVIGAGSAAAATALALGLPVGVLTISDFIPRPVEELLGERIVAFFRPEDVRTTLDLMTEESYRGFISAGEKLVNCGAKVVLLACTGYSTAGATKVLRAELNVPVIDPVVSAGFIAYQMVKT